MRIPVNIQKGSTILFCLTLLCIHKFNSPYQYVYAGLHGGYGFLWLLKVLSSSNRRT
jgi:hypothetical protein